ncbi:hypothetical protein [Methanobrevibacter ruminantium]|uniref:hypothetical protein n=1 Tax=Methanobrevibacter ruminantium TaxID=83816 RepID=UPI0026EFADC2|nr:hypothetical protein [Methanobrevibacter ruminantium]
MTFECTLNITGTLPEISAKAFIQSYEETSKINYYQKYYSDLEQYYQDQVYHDIQSYGLDMQSTDFHIQFTGNQLYFISESESAIKYEYGYDHNSPKRFMQSSVLNVTNKIANYMISDAIELYKNKIRF